MYKKYKPSTKSKTIKNPFRFSSYNTIKENIIKARPRKRYLQRITYIVFHIEVINFIFTYVYVICKLKSSKHIRVNCLNYLF